MHRRVAGRLSAVVGLIGRSSIAQASSRWTALSSLHGFSSFITIMAPIAVLNVAEKPSVARALAGVLAQMPGTQERPMVRRDAQIFTQENVCFPSVLHQGSGQAVHGPSECLLLLFVLV